MKLQVLEHSSWPQSQLCKYEIKIHTDIINYLYFIIEMRLNHLTVLISYRLINHLGWKSSFLVLGGVVVLIFFLAILFRPLPLPPKAVKRQTNDLNQDKISEEKTNNVEGNSSGCLPCGGCKSTDINNVIDMSIFKDGLFVMFAVSNLLSNTALNVPYIYTVVCTNSRKFYNIYELS